MQDSERAQVYRVQAADGRGPWRPGFSHVWADDVGPMDRISETLMDLVPIEVIRSWPIDRHYGCACRTRESLMQWFTAREKAALSMLGFRPVRMMVDEVLAESQFQLAFARRLPLHVGVSLLNWEVR